MDLLKRKTRLVAGLFAFFFSFYFSVCVKRAGRKRAGRLMVYNPTHRGETAMNGAPGDCRSLHCGGKERRLRSR